MAETDEIVVLPKHSRLFWILFLTCAGVASNIYFWVGRGLLEASISAGFAGITFLLFIIGVIRKRPNIVISKNGFTINKLFGEEFHQWNDIEGSFKVVSAGLVKLVGYHFTADYKARTNFKPTSASANYDAAIFGSYVLSVEEIVDLLNTHRDAKASPIVDTT